MHTQDTQDKIIVDLTVGATLRISDLLFAWGDTIPYNLAFVVAGYEDGSLHTQMVRGQEFLQAVTEPDRLVNDAKDRQQKVVTLTLAAAITNRAGGVDMATHTSALYGERHGSVSGLFAHYLNDDDVTDWQHTGIGDLNDIGMEALREYHSGLWVKLVEAGVGALSFDEMFVLAGFDPE